MIHTRIDLELKPDEPFYIKPISDIHYDSPHCDKKRLHEELEEAQDIPNCYVFLNGDNSSLLLPGDLKRFRNSASPEYMHAADNFLNQASRELVKLINKYPRIKWAGIGYGNHELSVLKHHSYDIIQAVCEATGIPRGGYSGYVSFNVTRKCNSKGHKSNITYNMLYHHGFPVGIDGGKNWAERTISCYEDVDLFVYGHNHQLHPWKKSRIRLSRLGYVGTSTVTIVNAGTFELNAPLDNCEIGTYAEIKGKPPVVIGCPLVKVTLKRKQNKETDKLYMETKVTI